MPSRPSSPRLRPCIRELLRTCVHPDSLLLRLEKVEIRTLNQDEAEKVDEAKRGSDNSDERSWKEAYLLWLGDGELMIQAVLEQPLHYIFETGECSLGSLLDVKRFRVRRGKRINGLEEVVYLAIADYETVPSTSPTIPNQVNDFTNEGGFIREEIQSPMNKPALRSPSAKFAGKPTTPAAMPSALSSQDIESDDFETAVVDPEIMALRRQALHELGCNTQSLASWDIPPDWASRKRRKLLEKKETHVLMPPARSDRVVGAANLDRGRAADAALPSFSQGGPNIPIAAEQQIPSVQSTQALGKAVATITPTSTPAIPPFHALSSLLQPPAHSLLPSRNYTCSVFAIISWCSPNLIFPRQAQSPFPPKRHIKIHDPTIASRYAGITLAVYDNAQKFKPKIGTVALFRSVVMQRWEGEVILNAYAGKGEREEAAGDGEKGGNAWYVDDEERLVEMGYDARSLKKWWVERTMGKVQRGSSELEQE
jgi:hypothetical protein